MSLSQRTRQRRQQPRDDCIEIVHHPNANSDKSDKAIRSGNGFHWDLWLLLALDNWIFDFGRPLAAMLVPLSVTPLDAPSIGDYFHMAYNVVTPFCLLRLLERSRSSVPRAFTQLCVITLVMGASIHLVGDSVNHRLIHLGYKNHMSVQDNPLMQELRPRELVQSFELLYRYDEQIGHLMWYVPFFLVTFIYFLGCFSPAARPRVTAQGAALWAGLAAVSGLYYWYLATEGQIFPLFLGTYVAMLVTLVARARIGLTCDINGLFLLATFTLSVALTLMWSLWLWDDPVLRRKYPGLIYVPEPWAFYTLYIGS